MSGVRVPHRPPSRRSLLTIALFCGFFVRGRTPVGPLQRITGSKSGSAPMVVLGRLQVVLVPGQVDESHDLQETLSTMYGPRNKQTRANKQKDG